MVRSFFREGRAASSAWRATVPAIAASMPGVMKTSTLPSARFLQDRGYADILVVSREGDVIYSVAKYDDFGINLREGPIVETGGLGQAFAAAMAGSADTSPSRRFRTLCACRWRGLGLPCPTRGTADRCRWPGGYRRARDLPFHGATSSIVFMASGTGLGETGESYVIGADGALRSMRRLAEGPTMLTPARASRRRGRRRRRLHLCG